MTTIRNITLLMLLLLTASAARAQQALFDKWEGKEGISTVYISRNLLRLMPHGSGSGFAKKADKIDQLRILSTQNAKAAAAIGAEAAAYYKKKHYEVAIKVNEGGQRMTIYQRKLQGGRTEYVLFAEEAGELSIINVEGTLSLDDLQDAAPSGKR
ncbi:MAG: DUF4252 domain-containing protein [Alloprevotella sp.]|nr:DUF4252 domain-containing protein [Alloprevotella sp.]